MSLMKMGTLGMFTTNCYKIARSTLSMLANVGGSETVQHNQVRNASFSFYMLTFSN